MSIFAKGKALVERLISSTVSSAKEEQQISIESQLDSIGVIYLRGEITGDLDWSGISRDGDSKYVITPNYVRSCVATALEDRVQGIIFDIDSPGGQPVASSDVADYINKIEVPKVALVHSAATSGAYWIASTCEAIIANPLSRIGSIGVLVEHMNYEQRMKKLGVEYDGFKAGKFKDMGSNARSFTDEERKIIQGEIDKTHDYFIRTVAKNRKMPVSKIRMYADGRAYLGKDALDMELIDKLGGIDEAVSFLEKLGGFDAEALLEYVPTEEGLAKTGMLYSKNKK